MMSYTKCRDCGEWKHPDYGVCPECTAVRFQRLARLERGESPERYMQVDFTCLGCGSRLSGTLSTTLGTDRSTP